MSCYFPILCSVHGDKYIDSVGAPRVRHLVPAVFLLATSPSVVVGIVYIQRLGYGGGNCFPLFCISPASTLFALPSVLMEFVVRGWGGTSFSVLLCH